MEKCRKAAYLISKRQDQQQLDTRERIWLGGHLLMCPRCREYRKQIELIQRAVKKIF